MSTVAPIETFDHLRDKIHADNVKAGWWTDISTGASILTTRNMGELLMLVVSEVSEAHEGWVLGCFDDKLSHRLQAEVELADVAIRLFDIAGARRVPLFDIARRTLGDRVSLSRCSLSNTLIDGALIAIVNAVSSAMEGDRKGDTAKFQLGITTALILTYEVGHDNRWDVPGAIAEKREFNRNRADHKIENRLKADGKKY